MRFRTRLLFAGLSIVGAPLAQGAHLTILATSDLHGHVEPQDELAGEDFGEGLARVASRSPRSGRKETPCFCWIRGTRSKGRPSRPCTPARRAPPTRRFAR